MSRSVVISLIAAAAVAALLWPSQPEMSPNHQSAAVPADEAAQLLIDRNWLNRWPTTKDDRLHVFRFVPNMGGGVYQDRTLFLGSFELFLFDVHGDALSIHLPDRDEKYSPQFQIERVSGPSPFDLKLTITDSPRGPDVYYGRSSETAATWHELDALLPTPAR